MRCFKPKVKPPGQRLYTKFMYSLLSTNDVALQGIPMKNGKIVMKILSLHGTKTFQINLTFQPEHPTLSSVTSQSEIVPINSNQVCTKLYLLEAVLRKWEEAKPESAYLLQLSMPEPSSWTMGVALHRMKLLKVPSMDPSLKRVFLKKVDVEITDIHSVLQNFFEMEVRSIERVCNSKG